VLIEWQLIGLILLFMLIFACGGRDDFTPPPPPQVTVAQPVRQKVVEYFEFTGNTQAINTVQLRARVQGFLEKVFFKDGDMVKKGQLLFLIQQNTYQDQLKQAEAEILKQKANYEHAAIETKRYTRLVEQKAAAQTDLENWRYQRDAYRAAVMEAQAARDLAKLNLEYTKVVAPFNGRIDRRLVDPGNLVGAGEFTHLATINQIDPIYAYFTINEADLLRVMGQTGFSAEAQKKKIPLYLGLANEEGYPHEGVFDFASITVDSTTGTQQLRGIFPNPDLKILPGLFVRIKGPITGSEKPSLLVPQTAIGFDQEGSYVLIVDDKNVVQRRSIKVGTKVGDLRVAQEGLTGNEWVITDGLMSAMPGRPVTPERKSPQGTPAVKGPATQTKPEKHAL
jgi:RND family efflux transporter MFP subunit